MHIDFVSVFLTILKEKYMLCLKVMWVLLNFVSAQVDYLKTGGLDHSIHSLRTGLSSRLE